MTSSVCVCGGGDVEELASRRLIKEPSVSGTEGEENRRKHRERERKSKTKRERTDRERTRVRERENTDMMDR